MSWFNWIAHQRLRHLRYIRQDYRASVAWACLINPENLFGRRAARLLPLFFLLLNGDRRRQFRRSPTIRREHRLELRVASPVARLTSSVLCVEEASHKHVPIVCTDTRWRTEQCERATLTEAVAQLPNGRDFYHQSLRSIEKSSKIRGRRCTTYVGGDRNTYTNQTQVTRHTLKRKNQLIVIEIVCAVGRLWPSRLHQRPFAGVWVTGVELLPPRVRKYWN